MNAPKVSPEDYIQFLVASPRVVSGTEAARVQPEQQSPAAHDAFTRLLHRLEPDPSSLWEEVKDPMDRQRGVLILDDTTLDKPYARRMERVTRHWSGKHHRVVQGITLLTLLWSDGVLLIPIDYRIYDKATDGRTKNDRFRSLDRTASERGFCPEFVLFDLATDPLGEVVLLAHLPLVVWLVRCLAHTASTHGEMVCVH